LAFLRRLLSLKFKRASRVLTQTALRLATARVFPQEEKPSRFFHRGIRQLGEITASDPAKLGPDNIRGESSAQEAAIKRRDFAFSEAAPNMGQVPLQPRADKRALVRLGKHGFERRVDVLIRHAPAAKFARNAKAPLPPRFRVLARVVERVFHIVQVLLFPQPRNHRRNKAGVFRTPSKILTHFVGGIGAPHQGANREAIQVLLVCDFASGSAHGKEE